MLSMPPALIAVVGPVEPPLLAAWARHYRGLGIERFLIAFHFPDHVPDAQRYELQAACRELGIIPTGTSTGPWHEHTNTQLRDALRHRAGPGWHLLADADEFQQYPARLNEVIAQAEKSGNRVVGGLMLDRVAASGRLTVWRPESGLDLAYPLGGHLTHRLLHGDPRKIVLARHDVTVSSGNHRSPGHRPDTDRICAVHHFKVLLADLTGSGKTTVAQALADCGYLRLSVDEEVHRLHGRYGVDYPEHTYFERERPWSKRSETGSPRRSRPGTTSSWTMACGAVPSAAACGLPPGRPCRTAAAPGRTQRTRGRQRADRHPRRPVRLLRPLRPPGRRRGRDRLHRGPGAARDGTDRGPETVKQGHGECRQLHEP
ncbi:glycosyltransferase family 2 protein [Streptomyces sp. NPDC002573]|uniref:glycosyltransferase family 2 protein n=1 Tax=Streptomyces sp. NPDC002573 TaxID=3364651 RepID=UPI0036BB780D